MSLELSDTNFSLPPPEQPVNFAMMTAHKYHEFIEDISGRVRQKKNYTIDSILGNLANQSIIFLIVSQYFSQQWYCD